MIIHQELMLSTLGLFWNSPWKILLALNVRGHKIKSYLFDRNNNFFSGTATSISNMAQKYIDAEYDAETNSLRIVATAALSDYEKEQFAEQITLIIDMSCTGNTRRRLAFNQLFDDSNNHDPVFAQSLYTIELMLPLPRGFDLTFFQEISVRDLDIRNNQVTFTSSIDNSVVTVEAASRVGEDQKTFIAILKTSLQLLTLLQPLEFDIIATVTELELKVYQSM